MEEQRFVVKYQELVELEVELEVELGDICRNTEKTGSNFVHLCIHNILRIPDTVSAMDPRKKTFCFAKG
jgi:hypothetical protein